MISTIYKIKDSALVHFISPSPDLPRQGGGVIASLPRWEGLREGDKMAFALRM
jgi:hypothetical protein